MMKQCYSWPLAVKVVFHNQVALVGVSMVLKECRLLSACTCLCVCVGASLL